MKARHIIMIIFLILAATIMFSLKEVKGVRTLECSAKSDFYNLDSVVNLKIGVKNKTVKDIDIVIDVVVPKEYQSEKQNLIANIESEGKMQVTSTKEGIRLKTGIQSSFFESLGLNTESSYNELKTALEFQGYTCK